MRMVSLPSSTLLFFGSFNPVRAGHLAIAEAALRVTGAEALWLVVSPQNPFKDDGGLAPERHRLAMARLAVQDSPWRDRIAVSDIEFSLERPSLTIRTLETLREKYPERRFALLIGSDNAERFDRWVRYEEILDRFPVLVYPREGYPPLRTPLAPRFVFLHDAEPGVGAATDIRRRIAGGEDPGDDLSPRVWRYIRENRLYGYDE